MENFNEYLIRKGKPFAFGKERELLHEQYQSEVYFKQYNQNRKTVSKLIRFWMKTPEYKVLSEDAGKLGLRVNEFIRKILKAYKQQHFVVPDEIILHDLIVSLSKLGCNLNQISHLCNINKKIGYQQIEEVKVLFQKIEATTLAHFKPTLLNKDYIKKQVEIYPNFISELERIIEEYKNMEL
jgi:hypothetical protein